MKKDFTSTIKKKLAVAVLAAMCGITLWQRPGQADDAPRTAAAVGHDRTVNPTDAISRLQEGNQRFVDQRMSGEHRDASRREEVAKGQHPFAIVLGCADSRVPPEVVFDQGLGDLFVVRTAGEVAPPAVVGSIEYAVEHLGCRTIVVLGHERCGAVLAALAAASEGHAPEGNMGELLKDIIPAVEKIDRKSPDAIDAAVRANAVAVSQALVTRSKLLGEISRKGELVITPARYDLDSGKVEFLEQSAPR